MNKYILMLMFLGIVLSGCRAYVGSSDIYKDKSYEMVSEEKQLKEQGVTVQPYRNGFELSFVKKQEVKKRFEADRYYMGREYYYYEVNDAVISNKWLYFPGVGYVVILIGDAVTAFSQGFIDWNLKGDYLPGIGYLIAYTPGINLLLTPVLRAPYVCDGYPSTDSSELKAVGELVAKKVHYEYCDDFEYDKDSTVTITHNGISKTYRLDFDGKLTFSIQDFIKNINPEDSAISFTIYHHNWNKKWKLTSSVIVDSEALRDFNIIATDSYDYLSRAAAIARLSPYFGEEKTREYLQKLLDDKLIVKQIPKGYFIIHEIAE